MNKHSLHPAVQDLIDRGQLSLTSVPGWRFMFLDGAGWGVSGWCPPLPPPPFPRQQERRDRRVKAFIGFYEMSKALGTTSLDVSQFEFGRADWPADKIAAYDQYLDEQEITDAN